MQFNKVVEHIYLSNEIFFYFIFCFLSIRWVTSPIWDFTNLQNKNTFLWFFHLVKKIDWRWKQILFTKLDTNFTFKKLYLFFYSMEIEGEDRIYEQKNPTFQESEKTIKNSCNSYFWFIHILKIIFNYLYILLVIISVNTYQMY